MINKVDDYSQKNRKSFTKACGCYHHTTVPPVKILPSFFLKFKWDVSHSRHPIGDESIASSVLYRFLRHQEINFFISSISSISLSNLSFRQRTIRGKRNATPDLCRLLYPIPSIAISKTSSGLTVRTGPNFSSAFRVTKRLTSLISVSVNPE